MKYDNGERHLKEINHVSILEPIDEKFDSATSLLTSNAVMYGSTVTALISGLKICGDLDIAVSNQEYMRLCQNFSSSVKWVQVDGKRIPERKPSDNSRAFQMPGLSPSGSLSGSPSTVAERENPYKEAKHLPIDKMVTFQTVNDNRVQIVQSKAMTGDRLEDALEVVRKVDFTFCGMAVDMYGRMLETIPHAYSDCRQRVIRIQDYQPRIVHAQLKARILKYVRRGWSLTMSIDQAMANLSKAKAVHYAENLGKKSKKKKSKPVSSSSFFRVKKHPSGGYVLETKSLILQKIGANDPVVESVRWNAHKRFGLQISNVITPGGILMFSGRDKPLSPEFAREIAGDATKHLRAKFGLDTTKIQQKEKKEKIASMYTSATYASYGSSTSSGKW